jgi:hypothetical protein
MTAPDDLFRAESENTQRKRQIEEARRNMTRLSFPEEARPELVPYEMRSKAVSPAVTILARGDVCHHPLYFEQRNAERDGRYIPGLQPILSVGAFYADGLLLPVQCMVRPPWTWDCSEGN